MTTIRAGAPGDVPALARIAEAAFAPYVTAMGRRPAPMDQLFEDDIAAGSCWTAGDPPKGYVIARPADGEWLLESVAVAADARGAGLGRALIAFAEAEGPARGYGRIMLYTNAAMTANLALYPRLGYRRAGRRVEDGYDRVYFEKELA